MVFFYGCTDNVKVPESVELNTWEDSLSYSIGADLGNKFKIREVQFDKNGFNKGFLEIISKDSSYAYGASVAANFIISKVEINSVVLLNALNAYMSEDSLILSNKDIGASLSRFDDNMRKEMERKRMEAMKKASDTGITYIDRYKKENTDAIETESGLIYRIIKEGFGKIPLSEDKVIVQYNGKFVDGTVFDSSDNRGGSATFKVSGLIKGWQEALQMMPVGSKWELVVPSILGYGEKNQGNVPGMSTLIFEVELLGIE